MFKNTITVTDKHCILFSILFYFILCIYTRFISIQYTKKSLLYILYFILMQHSIKLFISSSKKYVQINGLSAFCTDIVTAKL